MATIGNSFNLGSNADSSGPQGLHIPTEICENIIDMCYSDVAIQDTLKNIATLHSCALVCSAWRVRSQKMLFYQVQLSDRPSFHKLAAILDTAPHLRDYVHEVRLTGYNLHTTSSIFANFPAVFARKLPNLERIDAFHLLESSKTWYQQISDAPKSKSRSLPYIPLHPHVPAFLSSFTAVWFMYLGYTTFRSFTEFARMIHGLPNLEVIQCHVVRWNTPGGAHPGADITRLPDWAAGTSILPPFARKLRNMRLFDMASYGVQRMIWTRGPHLTELSITVPLSCGIEEGENDGGVDLSSCTGLQNLSLSFTPQFSKDKHATVVTKILSSWKPQRAESSLVLRSLYHGAFTRRDFADILRSIGTIIEVSLQTLRPLSPSGDPQKSPVVPYQVLVDICEWEAKLKWWLNLVDNCFPTWMKQRQVMIIFHTPSGEHSAWATEENPSPSDLVLPPEVSCGSTDALSEPGIQTL